MAIPGFLKISFVVGSGPPPSNSLTISVVMMGNSDPFPGVSSFDPSTRHGDIRLYTDPMTPGAYYLLVASQAGVPVRQPRLQSRHLHVIGDVN